MTRTQGRTIRQCLNQILVGVALSCIFAVGTTVINGYLLRNDLKHLGELLVKLEDDSKQRDQALKEYIRDPSVCLGASVCRPEYDTQVRNNEGRFRSIFQQLAVINGYKGPDIRRPGD